MHDDMITTISLVTYCLLSVLSAKHYEGMFWDEIDLSCNIHFGKYLNGYIFQYFSKFTLKMGVFSYFKLYFNNAN